MKSISRMSTGSDWEFLRINRNFQPITGLKSLLAITKTGKERQESGFNTKNSLYLNPPLVASQV
ncbi:MAG: hypothetical protein EWV67_14970 [Microcystis sp. M_QC_C_20170808_M2Col]|nr:MAG: hypothetical protein EWV67_14970 [Microcystis sp. M_QC_C_20170808_M2Col]TRT64275.1 MAG: hypothetical protein EWV68_19945 [Microcystis sp. M_QC_C_20170808_M9Col]